MCCENIVISICVVQSQFACQDHIHRKAYVINANYILINEMVKEYRFHRYICNLLLRISLTDFCIHVLLCIHIRRGDTWYTSAFILVTFLNIITPVRTPGV